MRFFGRDVRVFGELPQGEVNAPRAGRVGSPDLSAFTGYSDEDDLEIRDLAGRQRYRTYDVMAISDSAVRGLLWSVALPIRAAEWSVEAASDDPVDEGIADAVRWAMGFDDEPGAALEAWDAYLRTLLLVLRYGSITAEIEWADTQTWTDADGDEHLIRPFLRLGRRLPASIVRYGEASSGDVALDWVEQDLPKTARIPGEKLVHLVLDAESDRFRGVSLLRPAYGPWRLKSQLIVSAGVAYDRWASGIPIGRVPKDAGPEGKRQMERILRDVRHNERSFALLTGPPPYQNFDGYDLSILSGSGSIADPVPLLRHFDSLIYQAGLAQFSQLGVTEVGSRAVGETLSEPFYLALQAFAAEIGRAFTRQAVRRFVTVNFGERYDTPRVVCSRIERGIGQLTGAIRDLAAAGFTIDDIETLNEIRSRLQLPELEEPPVIEGADMVPVPPSPGPGPGPAPPPVAAPPPAEAVAGNGGGTT